VWGGGGNEHDGRLSGEKRWAGKGVRNGSGTAINHMEVYTIGGESRRREPGHGETEGLHAAGKQWGRGPLPPSFFFSKRGSPPHPCADPPGGHPLPFRAGTGQSGFFQIFPKFFRSRRKFRTKHRQRPCKKVPICGQRGEGGDPPTPPPSFF